MKRSLLSIFSLLQFSVIAFSQSTLVYYNEQTANYSGSFIAGSHSGLSDNGSNQVYQYANTDAGTKQVVSWRPFTTDGSNDIHKRRALQVGDRFYIYGSFTKASGKIGIALLSSPTSTSSWSDKENNYALSVNLDGPDENSNHNWYVKGFNGDTTSATSGGYQGSYHDYWFQFILTAPDRMGVYLIDITGGGYSTVLFLEDVQLNTSAPITDYCIYLENDFDGASSQNAYWGSGSTTNNLNNLFSTGNPYIGGSGTTFTEQNVIPDGLYADQTTTSYKNALTIYGSGVVTLTAANTYTGETTISNNNGHANNGVLILNHAGGNTIPVTNSVTVENTGTLQISSDQTLNNLTLASGSNLTIDGSATLTITGTLTDNGATIINNGNITLASTATGTASLAVVAGSIGVNVTVERYIPAHTSTAYTLVSSPVNTPSIYNAWQEGGANNNTGYGTWITGASAGNGFDAASAAGIASIYTYDDSKTSGSKWVGLTNTNTNTLSAGTGYLLWVRGDRSVQSGVASSTATTLRAAGTLTTGTVTFAPTGGTIGTPALLGTANAYNLIANPYACTIDWTSAGITKTNLSGTFTVYDPNLATFVTSDGTTISPNTSQQQAAYIQSGQAFFIQNDATGNPPSLAITEAAKTIIASTNSSLTVFGGTVSSSAQLNVNFYKANNVFVDGAVAVFNNNYSKQYDTKDADKFNNFNETISFAEQNRNLSIDARPMPLADTLVLNLKQMKANTNYTVVIDGSGFNNNNLSSAILVDKATSTFITLDLATKTSYSFTTTGTIDTGRLLIVLNNKNFATTTTDNSITDENLKVTLTNPVKDEIIINYISKQLGNVNTKLMTISGQVLTNINSGSQQQGKITIPVSQYSNGLYLIELKVGNNKVVKKVIKQ